MNPGVPTPQLLDYINQPDAKLRAENQIHAAIQAEREEAAAELARAAVNPPKGWRPDEGVSFVEAVDYRPTRVKMTLNKRSDVEALKRSIEARYLAPATSNSHMAVAR
jgi:hypothetical protein